MAIADIFNGVTFGGINSLSYGIFITGEAAYDAPKRAVNMVSVPGRNGDVCIDKGSWENLEVTYRAGVFGNTNTPFRKAIEDYRNALASQIGYQRLTDTYNPNEYRMAVFFNGIEVDNIGTKAGEFDLKFFCKPQRWLTSGESKVSMQDGDTITNPTGYDSEPVFEVDGYGTIHIGSDYDIDITQHLRGDVMMLEPSLYTYTEGLYKGNEYPYESDVRPIKWFKPMPEANQNDDITINSCTYWWTLYIDPDYGNYGDERIGTVTVTDSGGINGKTTIMARKTTEIQLRTVLEPATWSGTWQAWPTWAYQTHTVTLNVNYVSNGSATKTVVMNFNPGYRFKADILEIEDSYIYVTYDEAPGAPDYSPLIHRIDRVTTQGVTIDSTVYILGSPTYIDCGIGEAYKVVNDEKVSLNSIIDLGSNLPKLASGSNTITYDNTVTSLEVVPNWWKL